MKTLGNGTNNFAIFHKNSHLSTSRTNCNAQDKYLGHLLLKLTNVPSVFSTALPCFLVIIYKCQKGLGSAWSVWTLQRLALRLPIPPLLQRSHTGPSSWTAILGTSFQRQKEQQIVKLRRYPRSDASLTTSPSCRHVLYLPNFPGALLPTSCSVQYQRIHERSGKCSQIMWKQGI